MSTLSFSEIVNRLSPRVDTALEALLARERPVANLHEGLRYALGLDIDDLGARGKRVRPVLCLAVCEALGGRIDDALPFACAIELMHNFALVHDDIEDGDEMRRDRPAVWVRYGRHHGINIGDYLLCKVVAVLAHEGALDDSRRLAMIRAMSLALDHTHIGQALDMNARDSHAFTFEEYDRLVREKTGYYLAAAMKGGAIAAGADAATLDALDRFGDAMGPLFQVRDDVLDLTQGKGRGGAIGSDIREGKRSYLVAHATGAATDAERSRLYAILDRPRAETTDDDVAWVIDLFQRTGAIAAAERRCAQLFETGLSALEPLEGPLRVMLAAFAREMVGRTR